MTSHSGLRFPEYRPFLTSDPHLLHLIRKEPIPSHPISPIRSPVPAISTSITSQTSHFITKHYSDIRELLSPHSFHHGVVKVNTDINNAGHRCRFLHCRVDCWSLCTVTGVDGRCFSYGRDYVTLNTSADANGLQLNDIISLAVGLWAVKAAQQSSTDKYSFGVGSHRFCTAWMKANSVVVLESRDPRSRLQRRIPNRTLLFYHSRSYRTSL